MSGENVILFKCYFTLHDHLAHNPALSATYMNHRHHAKDNWNTTLCNQVSCRIVKKKIESFPRYSDHIEDNNLSASLVAIVCLWLICEKLSWLGIFNWLAVGIRLYVQQNRSNHFTQYLKQTAGHTLSGLALFTHADHTTCLTIFWLWYFWKGVKVLLRSRAGRVI